MKRKLVQPKFSSYIRKSIAFFVLVIMPNIQHYGHFLVGCWCGSLFGTRFRFAYGLADATAIIMSCSSKSRIQIDFSVLVPAHLGGPGQRPLNGCLVVFYVVKVHRSDRLIVLMLHHKSR